MNELDAFLVDRIKQGDERAFEQLYQKYYDLLCHFANQLLHNSKIAEEVVDDVFFHIWDTRDKLNILSLRSYLIRAVRNNSLRAISSSAYQSSMKSISLNSVFLYFNDYISDDDPSIGWIIEKEMEKQLMDAINDLPVECRNVFRMSRFEGKKYTEIAENLGISVNTVKYHIKNAIKKLSRMANRNFSLITILLSVMSF